MTLIPRTSSLHQRLQALGWWLGAGDLSLSASWPQCAGGPDLGPCGTRGGLFRKSCEDIGTSKKHKWRALGMNPGAPWEGLQASTPTHPHLCRLRLRLRLYSSCSRILAHLPPLPPSQVVGGGAEMGGLPSWASQESAGSLRGVRPFAS